MRIGRVVAGLVLVGGMATACGDDASDAPDDASKDDFCGLLEAAPTEDEPSQDDVDEWVDKLKDTGTPDDIDDDARHGYEVLVQAIDEADVDDIGEDSSFEDLVGDSDDLKDVQAFFVYYASKCSDLSTELPSDLPTELPSDFPTELPSDFPTELPSDFPTELPSDFPTSLLTVPTDFET